MAAPFDWGGRDWEGCAELIDLARSELGPSRVIVTSRLDLHALQPTDRVIINGLVRAMPGAKVTPQDGAIQYDATVDGG